MAPGTFTGDNGFWMTGQRRHQGIGMCGDHKLHTVRSINQQIGEQRHRVGMQSEFRFLDAYQ